MDKKVVTDVDSLGVTCDAELMGSWLEGVHNVPLSSKLLYDIQCVLRYYSEIISPGKNAVVTYPTENMTPCADVSKRTAYIPVGSLLKGEVDETVFTVCHELAHLQFSPSATEFVKMCVEDFKSIFNSIWVSDTHTILDTLDQEGDWAGTLKRNPDHLFKPDLTPAYKFLSQIFGWTMFAMNCVEDARIDALYPVGVMKYKNKSIANLKKNYNHNSLVEMKECDPHGYQVFKDYLMYSGVLDRDEEWESSFGKSTLRKELDGNCRDHEVSAYRILGLMFTHYRKLIQDKYKSIWERSSFARMCNPDFSLTSFIEGFGNGTETEETTTEETGAIEEEEEERQNSSPSPNMRPDDVLVETLPQSSELDDEVYIGGDILSDESELQKNNKNTKEAYEDLKESKEITNPHSLRDMVEGKREESNFVLSNQQLSVVQGFEFLTLVDCQEIFNNHSVTYKCGIVDCTNVLTQP